MCCSKESAPKNSSFSGRKCEGNNGEAVEEEVKLCDELETVNDR